MIIGFVELATKGVLANNSTKWKAEQRATNCYPQTKMDDVDYYPLDKIGDFITIGWTTQHFIHFRGEKLLENPLENVEIIFFF